MELKFIATGTPRSGTVYTAKLLTSMQLPCGHESVFFGDWKQTTAILNDQTTPSLSLVSQEHPEYSQRNKPPCINWVDVSQICADSSFMAAPFLNKEIIKRIPVIHIIRDPLKVISSMLIDFNYFNNQSYNTYWEKHIYKHLNGIKKLKSQIEKICFFYIKWNKMIQSSAYERKYLKWRVESGPTKELCKFVGVNLPQKPFQDTTANSGRLNQSQKRAYDLTWNDLPQEMVYDIKKISNKKIMI